MFILVSMSFHRCTCLVVVYHLSFFWRQGDYGDHWRGNPGDKSGAFVISSGSLWEMKTITQNKYFCQDKGPKHLGGRVVYKDGRSGPKISSGQCILLPLGDWHQWTGHQPYCTWRYRCIFFYCTSWKAWVNVGNDYIDVQM